jgi:hypothetical protein
MRYGDAVRHLAVLVACAACTPPAFPKLPSEGGPKWYELSSPHFTVWTDDAPEHATRLVRVMERMQQIVRAIAFPDAAMPAKTFVVAFRNPEELHAYIPRAVAALTFPTPNALDAPAIVLSVDTLDRNRNLLAHELAHVISFHVLHSQPKWFAEGLATYFETVRLDDDSGAVDIGVPQRGRFQELIRTRPVPLVDLFACNAASCIDSRFYATAWAFFAFLVNEHGKELVQYMQRMGDAPPEALSALWSQLFPALAPGVIDHELAKWIKYGKSSIKKFHARFDDVSIAVRELRDADVHAARGIVHHLHVRRGELPEITAALAADPTHVLARVIAIAHGAAVAPELAQRIVAAHPDDWRAWWVSWRAGGGDTAHGTMCTLIAKDPPVTRDTLCPPAPTPTPPPPDVTPP